MTLVTAGPTEALMNEIDPAASMRLKDGLFYNSRGNDLQETSRTSNTLIENSFGDVDERGTLM